MAEENDLERSLPATPRRLEQAREEGQVARSQELAGFLLLVAGGAFLWFGGRHALDAFTRLLGHGLRFDTRAAFDTTFMLHSLHEQTVNGLLLVAPLLLVVAAIAVGAPLAIGGWLVSAKPLVPDFSRIDPIAGFGRIFSVHSAVELAKALAKATLIGVAGAAVLWNQRGALAALSGQPLETALGEVARVVMLALACVVAMKGLIAAVDVPFQIWHHGSKLKMSHEDVRREAKETEGDPHVKAAIRAQQRERARRRMMAEVPKADVVVVNPLHYAVALRYGETMRAPRVVAKGSHEIAARIRDLATEHGVPVLQAPPLARALYHHTDVGDEIPERLYTAVAEVLAYIYQLRQHRAGDAPEPKPLAEVAVPQDLDPQGEQA